MTVERVTPRETRRRIGDWDSWPLVVFSQRQCAAVGPDGETLHWNLSDRQELAAAAGDAVRILSVREILATIVAPERLIEVRGERVLHLHPRRDQEWVNPEMSGNLPTDKLQALNALFREARIGRRFRGGILGRRGDCSRVAGLLATYAFYVDRDVLMVCLDRPLALMACHEGDLHAHSPDEAVLAACVDAMKQAGLRESPGGLRPITSDEWPPPDP